MIRQCFLAKSGIQFQADRLHEVGLDPGLLYPIVQVRPASLPASSLIIQPETKKPRKFFKSEMVFEHNHLCSKCSTNSPARESFLEKDGDSSTDSQNVSVVVDEEHEELHDALSPVFDQLALRRGWWILELLPLFHRYELPDGNSIKTLSINAGRSRVVPQQKRDGIHVHRSVKVRMEAEAKALGKKYSPRVKLECDPTWVD